MWLLEKTLTLGSCLGEPASLLTHPRTTNIRVLSIGQAFPPRTLCCSGLCSHLKPLLPLRQPVDSSCTSAVPKLSSPHSLSPRRMADFCSALWVLWSRVVEVELSALDGAFWSRWVLKPWDQPCGWPPGPYLSSSEV